ncbi:MAG: hypothetical protein SF066_05545, partial [Thermoanaerobaculia bacterium]|nr:hypothetical protein [Thermoanaerobaculia bacterium]
MTEKRRFRIESPDGTVEEASIAPFSFDERVILDDFMTFSAELLVNPLAKSSIRASLSLAWTLENGLKVQTERPPDDQVDALLMKLRPFILQDEPTFLPKVLNIVKKASGRRGPVHKVVESINRAFSCEEMRSSVLCIGSYTVNPELAMVVNSEEAFSTWLNGYRFHRDRDKRKTFESLHSMIPQESSVVIFMMMLQEKLKAIIEARTLLELVNGELTQASFNLRARPPELWRGLVLPCVDHIQVVSVSMPVETIPDHTCFDCTRVHVGDFLALAELLAFFWMHDEMPLVVGAQSWALRLAKGSLGVEDDHVEVLAIFKVIGTALLSKDPQREKLRNPEQSLLSTMRSGEIADESNLKIQRRIETEDEWTQFRDSGSREIDLRRAPRIAWGPALWPLSKESFLALKKCSEEGRMPSFEEVEGSTIALTYEIPERFRALASLLRG